MLRRGAAEYRTAAEIKPVEPETDNAGAGIGKTPICARLLLDAARMPKRRSKKMLSSELTEIEGIGEKKAVALLKYFKTIKVLKNATVDELCSVKGINRALAEKIYKKFNA